MKNFPWIMVLALLPLFSRTMEIKKVEATGWKNLFPEIHKKITFWVGNTDDDTFTAFRQINRSTNTLGDIVKAENQHETLTSLVNNHLPLRIVEYPDFSSKRGYHLHSSYHHEKNYSNLGAALQWNKRGNACCFLSCPLPCSPEEFANKHFVLNLFGQNGLHTVLIPNNNRGIYSKPFFNKDNSACLLFLDEGDVMPLCEVSLDDKESKVSLLAIDFPHSINDNNLIRDENGFIKPRAIGGSFFKIATLPVFLRACAQSQKIRYLNCENTRTDAFKVCDITGTSMPLIVQKWIEAYCRDPSTSHKDPVTDAVFHYIGGNTQKACDLVAAPSHYIEKDMSEWSVKKIRNNINRSHRFAKSSIKDCLKRCSLENTKPLQYFINNSTITRFIGPDGGTIDVKESCCNETTTKISFSLGQRPCHLSKISYNLLPISLDQKCVKVARVYECDFAYALKNKKNKTYFVHWRFYNYHDINETILMIEKGIKSMFFVDSDPASLVGHPPLLKLIMKPETLWDHICIPVRYYTQGDQSYTLKREFANPLSLLIGACKYIKKGLYDYQG
jgi:hypothetical protein